MRKQFAIMTLVTAALLTVCGCQNEETSHRLRYLAVQMEKNADWSIIDKDGNEVVKEEYPADARSYSQVDDRGNITRTHYFK